MTNWKLINTSDMYLFGNGKLSGREIYRNYKNTKAGGIIRNLLRENGVAKARKLALRAATRRLNKLSKVKL